ncbi:MAG: translation elongation factor 4 [Eubacteriales bacterium]|nr:translation elongation factor 4 [Eubacteriales bacterium]
MPNDAAKIAHIRNFCIIAHIDHGKSTLADCLIETCGTLSQREMQNQVLDNMDLERERGITIKAQAARLTYRADDGEEYLLNLIDTPGHVDFNYEVSRTLAACDGAILVVDAAQGVEAQTLANAYLAIEAGLEILPVINKIDLPAARPEEVRLEIEEVIGLDASDAPAISAKQKLNIHEVLEGIVKHLPPPVVPDPAEPLKALIFDSAYDSYRGAVMHIQVKSGEIHLGDEIKLMHTGKNYEVVEIGYFEPGREVPTKSLSAGDVGYVCCGIKNVQDCRVGDTVTHTENGAKEPLAGYEPVQQMVFCGIYPIDGADYGALREALEKLQLNDAALSFEAETSAALGFGFRCGFLGLLHYEIILERLEREYQLNLISTAPSVIYKIRLTNGQYMELQNPSDMPDPATIEAIEEPIVLANIMTPVEFVGNIMDLCQERRGVFRDMQYLDQRIVELHYEMPLNEIIYDFFDALKSRSRGYASLSYHILEYRPGKLVKLDILINGENVDALSFIVAEEKAYARARRICEKLKDNIPRHQFEVPVQASIGGKIIARETVRAYRKDVLAKCYGGDISRKKKLLEKQKEGKKRMRSVGSVEIPQEAFLSVLKLDD